VDGPAAASSVQGPRPWWRAGRWRTAAGLTGLAGRLDPAAADRLLALGLAGVGVAELLLGTSRLERGPLAVALALASTLPLTWRRRAPLAVAAAVAVAGGAPPLLQQATSGATYFAGLLAAYTTAAGCPRPGARAAGLALLLAAFTAHLLFGRPPGPAGAIEPSDLLFTYAPLLSVWVWGEVQRRRYARAAAAEGRAAAAERAAAVGAARAAAAERARLARELHDVVAHSVSVMVLQAGAARRIAEADPPRAREALAVIETSGREALAELRRLLGVLRTEHEAATAAAGRDGPPRALPPAPAPLAPPPGLDALEGLLERLRAAGLPVALRVAGPARPLPPGVDLSAYRIVQEALTNTLKHAGAARAEVVVRYGPGALEVEVCDHRAAGAAPPVPRPPEGLEGGGHGLAGMRERVAHFGGDLAVGPIADGFRVWAALPLGAPA
jgi:signal transduction histidine kinase